MLCKDPVISSGFLHASTSRSGIRSAHGAAGQSEGVWDGTVQLADNLVDSFLPTGVAVPPSPNGGVELPQSHL